jgi:hypothetical protein
LWVQLRVFFLWATMGSLHKNSTMHVWREEEGNDAAEPVNYLGVAAGLAACVLLPLLDHAGRLELTIPIGAGAGTIGAVIKVNWELRVRLWFWVTMAIITGLHVLHILYVPRHEGWVPAPLTIGFCILDLLIILGILNLVGRLFKGVAKTSA